MRVDTRMRNLFIQPTDSRKSHSPQRRRDTSLCPVIRYGRIVVTLDDESQSREPVEAGSRRRYADALLHFREKLQIDIIVNLNRAHALANTRREIREFRSLASQPVFTLNL